MILTPEALTSIRNYIKESVSYGKYEVGGSWYRTQIQNTEVLPDGRITVTMVLGQDFSESVTITGVQVYSPNDILVAQTEENIQCLSPEQGIWYRFRFSVEEV